MLLIHNIHDLNTNRLLFIKQYLVYKVTAKICPSHYITIHPVIRLYRDLLQLMFKVQPHAVVYALQWTLKHNCVY